jgi:multicomponent Na+:H+ antiporter subunit B
MVAPFEVLLIALVIASAIGALLLQDVLASVIAFAAYSLGISLLWIVLQAPDVALTEAAVGTGVMTILFLVTLARTSRPQTDRLTEPINVRTVLLVGAFVALLGVSLPALPAIGDPSAPVVSYDVTQHYLANAYDETGVKNAVTAVLAAYRGFDTLGEAVVVLTAGVVVFVVLRQEEFV